MMREIKFRAYVSWFNDEADKIEGRFIYSEYVEGKRDFGFLIHDDCLQHKLIGEKFSIKWGQFTGLHDKNGKEIYEGDIIKALTSSAVIVFFEGAFCCYDGNFTLPFGVSANSLEIIGNIHETPELLEAGA
jgi:uncharacterized phage protein (TIGR01671 family)